MKKPLKVQNEPLKFVYVNIYVITRGRTDENVNFYVYSYLYGNIHVNTYLNGHPWTLQHMLIQKQANVCQILSNYENAYTLFACCTTEILMTTKMKATALYTKIEKSNYLKNKDETTVINYYSQVL